MKRILVTLGLGVIGVVACSPTEPEEQATSASAPIGSAPVQAYFVVLEGRGASASIPEGMDPRSPAAAAITRKRIAEIEAEQAALDPALTAHGAVVIARLTRLANVVQVLTDEPTAARLAKLPGVRRVEHVPVMERTLDSAVRVIGAPQVWTGAPGFAGEGVTIGIIDSGIDYTHADFAGLGTAADYQANDPTVIEPGSFPTSKVIGGWDFAGDNYDGSNSPQSDADPLDCANTVGQQISGGHGTHVAGIAAGTGVLSDGSSYAGPYDTSTNLATFQVPPGVAPRASLFALKVFGCEGGTTLLASALDRAADPNNDGSFADRLDVVNGSLGTSYGLGTQTVGEIVTELTGVGTLVVAAAGNDGQNFFVTGTPASYPEVLSVAATSDNFLLNLTVTAPPAAVADYPISEAEFSEPLVVLGPISAPLIASLPALGCEAFTNAAEVAGKVVLIDRGTCPFVDKVLNAEAAGAVAAIIVDNEDEALPFAMTGTPGTSSIAGFMITLSHGAELKTALGQGAVTVALDPTNVFTGPGAELLAGFSARGPSPVDGRLKPEIAAPGLVDSAWVATGNLAVANGGTSMASPMIAGAAALVRQAQPALGPMEVKALLMNAGTSFGDLSGVPYGTGVVGGGRLDVTRAVAAQATAAVDLTSGEVGLSFGSIAATEATEVARTFELKNHGATSASFDLAVEPTFDLPGAVIGVEPAQIDLAAGQSALVTLTLALDPVTLGSPGPDPGTVAMQGNQMPQPRHYLNQTSGLVRISSSAGDDLGLPYTGAVRAASDRAAALVAQCDAEVPAFAIELPGSSAHPAPLVTALQLGELDDPDPESETDPGVAQTDLLAVGVGTNLATAPTFADAKIFFGLAVSGPWTTPARGPLSVVKVQVDTDEDLSYDYEIRVEARNPDGPFRDALVASTYNLATGQRAGRFPINVLTPDVAVSYPFNSTVLVLSAELDEIDLSPEKLTLRWKAGTERPDLLLAGDQVTGESDLGNLLVNAAAYGVEGNPVFLGPGPVLVDLAASATSPVDVLLLHHTNPPGKQWEVVSVGRPSLGNLSIAAVAPEEPVEGSGTFEVPITVTNAGTTPALDVAVTGSAVDGQIVSVAPAQGSCTAGNAIDCALGEIAPGASVTLVASVEPLSGSALVTLQAAVASDFVCEESPDDDSTSIVITVLQQGDGDGSDLEPGGGCDCATARGHRSGGHAAWWLLAAGLALGSRRRPRAR